MKTMLVNKIDLDKVNYVTLFEKASKETIKGLFKFGLKVDEVLFYNALKRDSDEILQAVLDQGYKLSDKDLCNVVVLNRPTVLKTILKQFPDFSEEPVGTLMTDFACDYNFLEVLDVLLSFNFPISSKRMKYISNSDLPQNKKMKDLFLKYGLIEC